MATENIELNEEVLEWIVNTLHWMKSGKPIDKNYVAKYLLELDITHTEGDIIETICNQYLKKCSGS